MADIKLENTLANVRALFGDTSVDRVFTIGRMQAVIDEAKTLIQTLDDEQEKEEEELLLREQQNP